MHEYRNGRDLVPNVVEKRNEKHGLLRMPQSLCVQYHELANHVHLLSVTILTLQNIISRCSKRYQGQLRY